MACLDKGKLSEAHPIPSSSVRYLNDELGTKAQQGDSIQRGWERLST
jgi:hypothetical protein